jgi:hypothetical protein
MRDNFTDSSRILRDALLADRSARLGGSFDPAGRGTPRFVGQVYDGGSIPQGSETVYLLHPVVLDGSESEGGVAGIQVDTRRSIPVVVIGSRQVVAGDMLIAHAVGGRWIAESRVSLPNCAPQCQACPGISYAVNGAVDDPINGTQPLVYDFTKQAWFSAWLPFTSRYILTSGVGQNPCSVGNGASYYFHRLTCSSLSDGQVVASLFLPGQTCHKSNGVLTNAYFGYSGTSYPALLGPPANSVLPGFTLPSSGSPSSCDPLSYSATWAGNQLPLTRATYSIPKFLAPSYGYTCATPCPLPQKNLTVSWVNTGGNGSAPLVWNTATKDWTMACAGDLTIRLHAADSKSIGFTATVWNGADCSGTSASFNYPTSISMTSYTCDPLDFTFKVLYTSSLIYTKGYRTFTVTE